MKNMKKNLVGLMLCFTLVFISVPTLYAQETVNYYELDKIDANDTTVVNFKAIPVQDEELGEDESRNVSYLPNSLSGALIPGNTGIAVVFKNSGFDKISKVSFKITIYNQYGGLVASRSDTLRNLKVGSTTYTWTIAKSKSGDELIYLEGTAEDGGETFTFSTNTVRYK